jgi:enoyl-CoA hydratase/carnithine racemase
MTSVLVEQHGAVLVATLNRPEARNAIDASVMAGIAEAVERAEADDDLRALLLTAAGDGVFCAGMDLRAFAAGNIGAAPPAYLRLLEGTAAVPVVAAVQGGAVGGGCELVLGADVVVASTAAFFGLPEVKRGLFAGLGVLQVGRRLPLAIALELALTGDRMDATRAERFGLVNEVVPAEQLYDVALALATRIAANAPLSLAATKELVRAGASGTDDVRGRLADWSQRVFGSDDAKEGAAAFLGKRDPVWSGR